VGRRSRCPKLVVKHGRLRGQVFEVRGAELVLGCDPDGDITLDTPNVSRSHVRLTQDCGGTWVTDLHTVGGTTVNGERIRGITRLHPGDELVVGDVTLVFVPATVPAAHPVPPPRAAADG
jgi:pSer/pThr/pTyr-binding forkhead associated (FHA) protein